MGAAGGYLPAESYSSDPACGSPVTGVTQAAMMMRKTWIVAALALAPACSKKDPAEKMVSAMEDLGAAVDAAKGDCTKMAEGVEAVMNKYDFKELKETGESLKQDKEKAKQMMEKYNDRVQKVMPKMMDMMKCASDPKMKELTEKMKGMM
jgi:hypothetical protein